MAPCSSSCWGHGGPSGPLFFFFFFFFFFLVFFVVVFFAFFWGLFCPICFCLFYCIFFFFSFFLFAFFSFCLLTFLSFCHFVFLTFCVFVFLYFCHHYHTHRVHIYYHTNFCSNPKKIQFNHTFYHKPLPLLSPTPHNVFFFRGLQRFWEGCEDLATISKEEQEYWQFGSRFLIIVFPVSQELAFSWMCNEG